MSGTTNEVWKLHQTKTEISGFLGGRACHHLPIKGKHREVEIRQRSFTSDRRQRAFYANLQRSKSYTCPVAHTRLISQHQADIAHLTRAHQEAGGTLVFGTYTMKTRLTRTPDNFYSITEALRQTPAWDEVKKVAETHPALATNIKKMFAEQLAYTKNRTNSWDGWDFTRRLIAVEDGIKAMFSGKAWSKEQKAFGVMGRVLSIEPVIKPGADGWKSTTNNLHIHFLLFLQGTPSDAEVAALKAKLWRRWSNRLKRHHFTATLNAQQLKLVPSTITDTHRVGQYIAKGVSPKFAPAHASFFTALTEAAKVKTKDGRTSTDSRPALFFRNMEGACFGKSFFRISPQLAAHYNLKADRARRRERYDTTVKETTTLCFINRSEWVSFSSSNPNLKHDLLKLAETEGVAAVHHYLASNQVPFTLTPVGGADDNKKVIVVEQQGGTA